MLPRNPGVLWRICRSHPFFLTSTCADNWRRTLNRSGHYDFCKGKQVVSPVSREKFPSIDNRIQRDWNLEVDLFRFPH